MQTVYHRLSEMVGERLKTFRYSLMTLLCLAGVVSCSSDDVVVDTPNETGTVNTQFVLSVSTASTATTRMSDANTQALSTNPFRGIDNAKLLGYKLTDNGKHITTATAPSKIYDLGEVLAAGTITAADASHVQSLDMEVNTNTLLFYGKAIKDGTDQQQGKINFHVGEGGSDTYFELQSRVADAVELENYETAIETILNDVLGAKSGTQGWANYGTSYQDPTQIVNMNALEKTLGEAYAILTTVGTNEARAGSGTAILRTIDDVWKYVKPVADTTPDEGNALVVAVATDIVTKLSAHFEYVSGVLKFKAYTSGGFSLTSTQLEEFPVNLNLPAGVEQLTYAGGQFAYKSSAMLGMGSGIPVGNITWPAELCYFGNSPVRTSTVLKNKANLPATVSAWDAKDWTDFETNSKVLPSTRTVAMQNDINYGTALLETTVKYNAATLNDNNSGIHTGESDNPIDATASPFELTGIMVGGQYNKVGWNYLPMTTTTDVSDAYVIYDNDLSDGAKTIPPYTASPTASAPNYTLVFDNYVPEATQKSVFVCLEFKNNSGKDFYGESNLIAKGETFYLLGKLQLPESPSIAFPNQSSGVPCHALPPYNSTTGYTDPVARVFIQDYVTKANFVIGANSLKKAFVTVPDLRITELSLGLAVDLTWGTGPVFNDIELGD